MVMYRVLLTILILAFAAGVTCAAVCGQQSGEGQKHEDGSRCDECVSMAFVSGAKIIDAGLLPMPDGELTADGSISVLFVRPLVLLPQLPSDSPPSVIATLSILRI
jgi:hypothetical protein